MKQIIKILMILVTLYGMASASPARGGVLTFSQPDGTTFKGLLKGDSSFHWIESNSHVVIYNPKDQFYYYAKITKNNRFELTQTKAGSSRVRNAPARSDVKHEHSVSKENEASLYKMSQMAKEGNHPR